MIGSGPGPGWPPAHVNCRCVVAAVPEVDVDTWLVEQMRPRCEWRDAADVDLSVCDLAAVWIVWDSCGCCGHVDVTLHCDPHFREILAGSAWHHCVKCGHVEPVHGARAERL